MSVKQVVARTYPNSFTNPTSHLREYLSERYKVVMCNKFKVDNNSDGNEYILEKDENK